MLATPPPPGPCFPHLQSEGGLGRAEATGLHQRACSQLPSSLGLPTSSCLRVFSSSGGPLHQGKMGIHGGKTPASKPRHIPHDLSEAPRGPEHHVPTAVTPSFAHPLPAFLFPLSIPPPLTGPPGSLPKPIIAPKSLFQGPPGWESKPRPWHNAST